MPTDIEDEINDEKNLKPLDEHDIALLKTSVTNFPGLGPYSINIKEAEKDVKDKPKRINDLCGIKESDTGLAAPSQWVLDEDDIAILKAYGVRSYSISIKKAEKDVKDMA
ncbi:26S proteasome regulatory subunit 7 homolog A-like isoform X1 [Rutidosis leptorrhynchoides]|uniref:26S proteasome regulatory subunit 7 homolog A-like isoform X1 n=1 Tax=Rutidosis leptorrhynchoides TaxID=125765 RepID=UPI003A99B92F